MYMSENELSILRKLMKSVNQKSTCLLNKNEKEVLSSIIQQYTKPKRSNKQ